MKHSIYNSLLGIELIQRALGTRERLSHVPTAEEWLEAYDFATKQTVIGICYMGVSHLQNEQVPDLDLLMEWIGQAEYIKSQNEVMNERCQRLCEKLKKDGFQCCILKGQSNHANYGKLAAYRTSGDIDVWVKPKERVVDYVRQQNLHGGKKSDFEVVYHHVDWEFEGTPVELHMRPSWMYNPVTNRRLQKWADSESSELQNYGITELGFPVPSNRFNQVYQLVHIYRHLFNEGIGLRQLIDYYFVLVNSRESKDESYKIIKSFGMKHFCAAVMWIMVEYLGMSVENVLCPPNEKHGRFLLEEIMKAGNFGKYDKRLTYDRNKLLERGWGRLKRMSRLMCFGPWEVICAPGWKVWHYFWRKRQ